MKVEFQGQLKKVSGKIFVSGDTGAEISIHKDNLDQMALAKLNALQGSDHNKSQELKITISDE